MRLQDHPDLAKLGTKLDGIFTAVLDGEAHAIASATAPLGTEQWLRAYREAKRQQDAATWAALWRNT